jgi:hypothetical protein
MKIYFMLDLYLIANSESKLSQPSKREHIGGIEDELFHQLQTGGIIAPWFDYYSTFRWESEIANRILLKLQENHKVVALQKEEIDFINTLLSAVNANCGVLAIGG